MTETDEKAAPVEILLVEDNPGDVRLTKPVDFDKFMHVVKSIDSFWLTVVTLPPAKQQ